MNPTEVDSVELTFWCLCSLLNRPQYRHRGMFLPGFPKLAEFTKHWETIFEMALPKLSRHFEVENVFSQMYLTKWFLQTFLDRLPFHLCIRLWDVYLLEGDLVVLGRDLKKLQYLHFLYTVNLPIKGPSIKGPSSKKMK